MSGDPVADVLLDTKMTSVPCAPISPYCKTNAAMEVQAAVMGRDGHSRSPITDSLGCPDQRLWILA